MEKTYFHQNNEMISSQSNQQHELIEASIHKTKGIFIVIIINSEIMRLLSINDKNCILILSTNELVDE